ncbi:hypothetical protein HK105_207677 [Polyrhizophydium stewartii]|uniref:HotDog ACOT-type domain-containing protein n=1 Tax=Polyrhizophydium stewartii TaxID=2732419 RepID=A0ABR4MZW7_9FUNG
MHPSRSANSMGHRKWMDEFRDRIRSMSAAAQQPVGAAEGKRPRDSYVEMFLRFGSDAAVLDEYINTYGSIRVGKVLEDLDALAAAIAFLHVDAFTAAGGDALTVVTASVDRIDMLRGIPTNMDVKMSGHITYVGSSSIEISIAVETCPQGAPPPGSEGFGYEASFRNNHPSSETIITAKFIMVALDPKTGKPAKVHQLRLETDEDNHNFLLGAEHKLSKKESSEMALSKVPPKLDEMLLIHELHRENQRYQGPDGAVLKPKDVIWMKEAVQESLTICMPQERNLHHKIFGGYLMRLAFELAYANALIFAESPIVFVALDDITFRQPVNIGSLLALRSQVVYAPGAPSMSFQVMVVADVINPQSDGPKRQTTNTFHFTFAAPKLDRVPRVMPETYEESMNYIEGRRRKQRWVEHQTKVNRDLL